jgi:hypothetical protein
MQMVKIYSQASPELCNPDINAFPSPGTAPSSTLTISWFRWKIAETARRTIFLANIINLLISHNHTTGQQHPYYEPLDDDMILNMPLPCSHAAWTARSEEEWRTAIQMHPSSVAELQIGLHSSNPAGITLGHLFTYCSKDYLQREFGQNLGFSDSDKLRNFIILSACEQFIA